MTKNDSSPTQFKPVNSLNWLFLDLNSFFASVEQQNNPHLRGKPVAVVPMMTDSTCAIAASYEAKAYGIKTGTKIYEAKKMCPDLQLVLASHDKYVEYHHRVFDEVGSHIPVSKICSIDEASCELLGPERIRENAVALARKIKQGLRENVGEWVKCSIGIAPNAYLAKIATDMQKPDGLTVLEPGNYKDRLFALDLRDLTGIGQNMNRRLVRGGVTTIEQLWNLTPKHARRIWGSVAGEVFWYRLHGYEIPDKETTKRVVGHSRVLDPAHRPPEAAYEMARQLSVKAATRLRRYALYARKFALSVRDVNGYGWSDDISFSPTQDNFTFVKALETLWQKMLWDMRPTRLKKVSILIHDLHEPKDVTLDLFAIETPAKKSTAAKSTALSTAIDDLSRKFGGGAVRIGSCPKTAAGYVGTKIAFTRVPGREEFED
ncbi:MAG: impB/mucB/samB family protein [Micavibrio sp.]|nr:impB/mucB/samB family protein [Micavibrio sp.]